MSVYMVVVAARPMTLLIQTAAVTVRAVVRHAVHRPSAIQVMHPSPQGVFARVLRAGFAALATTTPIKLLPQSKEFSYGHDWVKGCCAFGDALFGIANDLRLAVRPVISIVQFTMTKRRLTPLVAHGPTAVADDRLHQRMAGNAGDRGRVPHARDGVSPVVVSSGTPPMP